MLTKNKESKRTHIEMISLDQLIPKDHLVRKIEKAISFDFVYELVEDKYSLDNGRPSIDPVILVKIALIQYMFGIVSMRKTINEIKTNVAYRWFLGYGLNEEIPHFTTFGKNYVRRFKGTDIFERIFERILQEAISRGFVKPKEVFIDSTHVKASANKKKFDKKIVEAEAKTYKHQLEEEINKDREMHGLKPLKAKDGIDTKEVKESTTDPDSGMLNKSEKEKCFAYSFHTACDRNGFVLASKVTAANVHDSQMLNEVLEAAMKNVGYIDAVAVDAGYKTPYVSKVLIDMGIRPVMPYKRPQSKDGFFKKHEYVYDEYYDCYICPNNQILKYVTTNRQGYREYRSDSSLCSSCPFLGRCTESKNHTKVITRHVWEEYLEEAEHLRHTDENKAIYAKRKETIERVFADMKEKHGMRWTTLRGIDKLSMQAMLVFTCMNLKKLANWVWKSDPQNGKPLSFLLKMFIRYLKPTLQAV